MYPKYIKNSYEITRAQTLNNKAGEKHKRAFHG